MTYYEYAYWSFFHGHHPCLEHLYHTAERQGVVAHRLQAASRQYRRCEALKCESTMNSSQKLMAFLQNPLVAVVQATSILHCINEYAFGITTVSENNPSDIPLEYGSLPAGPQSSSSSAYRCEQVWFSSAVVYAVLKVLLKCVPFTNVLCFTLSLLVVA